MEGKTSSRISMSDAKRPPPMDTGVVVDQGFTPDTIGAVEAMGGEINA